MFYHLHCRDCHHEWDSLKDEDICDWCGGGSIVLQIIQPINFSALLSRLIELDKMEKRNRRNQSCLKA